jgi:hypothetical protein
MRSEIRKKGRENIKKGGTFETRVLSNVLKRLLMGFGLFCFHRKAMEQL